MKNSGRVAGGEAAVAEHDQHAAPDHRALLTDQTVGDPATHQPQQVRAGNVQAVNRAGGLDRPGPCLPSAMAAVMNRIRMARMP